MSASQKLLSPSQQQMSLSKIKTPSRSKSPSQLLSDAVAKNNFGWEVGAMGNNLIVNGERFCERGKEKDKKYCGTQTWRCCHPGSDTNRKQKCTAKARTVLHQGKYYLVEPPCFHDQKCQSRLPLHGFQSLFSSQ